VPQRLKPQSCRKATAGSTFMARCAGIWQANNATMIKTSGVAAIVAGSYGDTPTNCDCKTRFTAIDTAERELCQTLAGRRLRGSRAIVETAGRVRSV
jgi:hypothetical protein